MVCVSDRYQVNAPLEAVSFFHHDTRALIKLTPPPVIVRMQRIEPLANSSQSEFTLWFGPLPVRWLAIHTQVDPENGFIDTQARGPMKSWVHTHHWQRVSPDVTLMEERIEFEHLPGSAGIVTRLLFAQVMIKLMLQYRKWIIRHETKKYNRRS